MCIYIYIYREREREIYIMYICIPEPRPVSRKGVGRQPAKTRSVSEPREA